MSKVVVIGIDGATWNLLMPWIEDGNLPNLRNLYQKGAFANLESTIPPLTPPAWTSAFTGVNPGKHNIYDFIYYDGYEKKITFSNHRKRDCLWNYIGEYNKKSIILNVPGTYPPEKINGIMISGMGTPSTNSNFTYPQDIKKHLIDNHYIIEYGSVREWAENKADFISNVNRMTEIRGNTIRYLMRSFEWDIFSTILVSIDRLQHIYWKTDGKGNLIEDDYQILKDAYKKMDEVCGEIINITGNDKYIFVISDHGFGPIDKGVFLNNYLLDHNYLSFQKKSFLKRTVLNQSNLVNIVGKIDDLGLRKAVNKIIPSNMRAKVYDGAGMGLIDWSKTIAWYGTTSGHAIHINLKGRQPDGVVEQDDYNNVCDQIIQKLYELKDQNTGGNVIKKCYNRENVYSGPFLKNAPDIIIEPEKGYTLQDGFGESIIGFPREGSVRRYGDHEKYGIFMCYGPEIVEGMDLGMLSICDVYPTILHMLQIPLPNDLDGRVISEMFKEDSIMSQREVRYIDNNKEKLIKKINTLRNRNKL